ncbi:MAG: hypothetical protein RSC68_34915, partial [Acinetobacter sp.]
QMFYEVESAGNERGWNGWSGMGGGGGDGGGDGGGTAEGRRRDGGGSGAGGRRRDGGGTERQPGGHHIWCPYNAQGGATQRRGLPHPQVRVARTIRRRLPHP